MRRACEIVDENLDENVDDAEYHILLPNLFVLLNEKSAL